MFVFLWLKTNPYHFGTSVAIYFRKTDRLQDVLQYFEMTFAFLGSPTLPSDHSALLHLVFLLHFVQSGLMASAADPIPSAFARNSKHFYPKSHSWLCKMQSDHLDLCCHLNAHTVSLLK